uniref:Anaerobic ribonucleoside-triphosphate reductase activating protein n=1 Tax=Candidatus Kentrum sp. DK TaxID=2126562 RepID=A0A450SV76_9GAMM|nr:MAG: anaerobic ribonucleoside-triphosphate reductase activating protein [Candidatus Kentron sp. DK]VFJ58121.1 MAG: anaerobic ribonucleoside-triphosphate reductase activating protein [Candidatus Kentron sp. DK]
MASTLLIHDLIPNCEALGPGRRFVISVQGCSLRCPGCLVPGTHDPKKGREVSVRELAERILEEKDIDGITLIGGEPMEQARPLVELLEIVDQYANLSVFTYTGYTLRYLLEKKNTWQLRLLNASDMVCDGPFVLGKSADDLLWRGSANQRIYVFSESCRKQIENLREQVKMEFRRRGDRLQVMGVVDSGVMQLPLNT